MERLSVEKASNSGAELCSKWGIRWWHGWGWSLQLWNERWGMVCTRSTTTASKVNSRASLCVFCQIVRCQIAQDSVLLHSRYRHFSHAVLPPKLNLQKLAGDELHTVPRQAWHTTHRPPSSVMSGEITLRTGRSKKEEEIANDWSVLELNKYHRHIMCIICPF